MLEKKRRGGGGGSRFSAKLFSVTVLNLFVGEPSCAVFLKFSSSGKVSDQEEIITIFYRNLVSHSTETFRWGALLSCVSQSFWFWKSWWIRGGGREYHDFLSKIFCLTEPKVSVGEIFSGSLFSRIKKVYGSEGAYHNFQSKFLCLTVPKNFVRESYYFRENFWFRKVLWMKRGDHVFPSKIFGLMVPKNFVGIPSLFQKVWGIEKHYA